MSCCRIELFSPSCLSLVPRGGDDGGETHPLPLLWDRDDLALDTAESLSESTSILFTIALLGFLEVLVRGLSELSFKLRLLLLLFTRDCLPVGSGFVEMTGLETIWLVDDTETRFPSDFCPSVGDFDWLLCLDVGGFTFPVL